MVIHATSACADHGHSRCDETVMLPLPPAALRAAVRVVPWPVKPGQARTATEWWLFDPGKAERELGFTTRALAETIAATVPAAR